MWKYIPGWENSYKINENGNVVNKRNENIKGCYENGAGYYRVYLYDCNRNKKFFIHRLVASLFIPNPNNYKEVNHIDGNKKKNSVSNLEWCDRTCNEREAHRIGIKPYKLFYVVFSDVRFVIYEFKSDLAKELNVTVATVKNYLHKKSFGYKNIGIKNI